MYYDLEAPGAPTSSTRPPPPFRVDIVTGCDASTGGGGPGIPEAFPLSQLYFCDGCSRVVSRRELAEDVDSYYCPNCLELMPSSEAMIYGMRCSKCWECPVCGSTLTTAVVGATGGEQSYHHACSFCRWSSRGRFEAPQAEQMFNQILAIEREGEPRQRMSSLVEAFRVRAQEQQRERELAQRLRRRSSIARGSFAATSISPYAARRFSSAMMLRTPRLSFGSGHHHAVPLDGTEGMPSGPWRMDNLEAKLSEQAASANDIRSEARAAARAAAAAATAAGGAGLPTVAEGGDGAGPAGPATGLGARTSVLRASLSKPVTQQGIPELPVLEGLTVEELLRQHTQPSSEGQASLLKEMQRSLEEDVDRGIEGVASLPQRLQQISYGYARAPGAVPLATPATDLRQATVQLEAPLQHGATWALLPLRKPLLTKRSRRCRLLTERRPAAEPEAAPFTPLGGASGRPAPIPEGDEAAAERPSTDPTVGLRSSVQSTSSKKGEEIVNGLRVCRNIVVKPQINPCFNPPFVKNNTAMAFIPRFIPWAWISGEGSTPSQASAAPPSSAGASGTAESSKDPMAASKGLGPGEVAQLVFTMSNPLDADVEFHLNPRAFNSMAVAEAGGTATDVPTPLASFEQNVEVLTSPFETALSRFQDLADVHEVWGEETERMKLLKAQDDPDIIPDRKLHKILVRLRFRSLASEADTPTGDPAPWVFFCRAKLIFTDATSTKHEVHLVLRFAAQPSSGPVRGGAVLLGDLR